MPVDVGAALLAAGVWALVVGAPVLEGVGAPVLEGVGAPVLEGVGVPVGVVSGLGGVVSVVSSVGGVFGFVGVLTIGVVWEGKVVAGGGGRTKK